MVMYAKIRRMFYREHLFINEIRRRTSLSRNTIKKWLKAPNDSAVKYQRAKKPGKLTPFESRLLLALEADARRPRKGRRTAKMLFDAHTRAFTAFGGIPKRGIYDNMKTAVDKVSKGNGRVVDTRFYAMTAHYLFEPDFCNVASGWEKGVVEKNVQDMRRRIWSDAKQQQFSSFEELNRWLEARCRSLWSEIQHPDYTGITLADALEQEQLYLMPMPAPFDGYIAVLARVSNTCLITLLRNRYSVPCRLANQMAAVHQYADRIEVVHDNTVAARHVRLLDSDQVSYDWQHYIPVIEKKPGALRNGAPFAELPAPLQTALRRRERQQADRIMAKVLSLVPTHGLDAVLVAVELVLESGVTSAEHVSNILARLKNTDLPAQVKTTLKLNEEPKADTARYDRLNAKEVPNV